MGGAVDRKRASCDICKFRANRLHSLAAAFMRTGFPKTAKPAAIFEVCVPYSRLDALRWEKRFEAGLIDMPCRERTRLALCCVRAMWPAGPEVSGWNCVVGSLFGCIALALYLGRLDEA